MNKVQIPLGVNIFPFYPPLLPFEVYTGKGWIADDGWEVTSIGCCKLISGQVEEEKQGERWTIIKNQTLL